MKTSFYILLCSLIVFVGCEKKQTGEMTTVTFTMPDLSVDSQQNVFSRAASAPATINEVNCFAVMVEGPEPFLKRTTCTVVDSVGSQVAASKSTGLFRGLIPSGGSISLSIPAGVQRKFTLFGVKASPITACMDFNSPNVSPDFTSDLFVVGESSSVDLQPGVTVNVPIQLPTSGTTFNTGSARIGDCTGPDNPFKARVVPTKATVVKDYFPYDHFQYNACNAVNINFTDDAGRPGSTSAVYNMVFERAQIVSGSIGSYSTSGIYTDSGCTTNIPSEFTVATNTRNLQFYTSTSVSPSVDALKFRLKPGISNPSPYAESISEAFIIAKNSEASIEIFGTRRVVEDMCYDMEGTFKTVDMEVISGTAYTASYPDIEGKVFPGKDCIATALVSGTPYAITTDTRFDFSVRFTQDIFAATYFSLTPTTSVTSATVAGKYPVQVVGGSRNPVFLRPDLPSSLPLATTGCFGPYQVLVENERGGALVTEGAIVVSILSGAPSNVAVFNNNLCNQVYASSFADDYRRTFYIGVSTTAIVSPQTISIRALGQIDHPDSLGDSAFTTSLTTVVPLQFK